MKKYVFIIGLVAFFIALPNRVYSQQNVKLTMLTVSVENVEVS